MSRPGHPCRQSLFPFLAGFLGFLVAAAPASAQRLTRGPYLQQQTPTSVLVRWRTDVATPSSVKYGTTAGSLSTPVLIAATATEHQVRLTGLTPDTQYFYQIGTSRIVLAGGPSYSFFTPPPVGTAQPTRIWVLGDSGDPGPDSFRVRDAYATLNGARYTDVVLMLGDNAYESGRDPEYQTAVFDPYSSTLRQTTLWPTIGNHDTAQSTNPPLTIPYFQNFSLPSKAEAGGIPSGTEKYYSFNFGNVHFICLDSQTSSRAPVSPMLLWLQKDLKAVTAAWIIAYWHHPPYSKGSHDSDTEIELMQMRANVLPILETGGVDLVLCGHSHAYERSFLLDGFYGLSNTLTPAMKLSAGNGQEEGTGAYHKPAGQSRNQGAVYITAGVSAHLSAWTGGSTAELNPNPHPAMVTSMLDLGSLVLDVDGARLDVRFLRDTGQIADHFTMLKDIPNNVPEVSITTPAASDQLAGPSKVTVKANAQDLGGSIKEVAFYAGSRLLAVDREAPYEAVWANPKPGNYQLTAVALDNLGATVTSSPVPVKIKQWSVPPAPTGLMATAASSTQVDLSWTDNATNESRYAVFKWNGRIWVQIALLPAGTIQYSRLNLQPGRDYRFQVRAWNALGYSKRSEIVDVTTPP